MTALGPAEKRQLLRDEFDLLRPAFVVETGLYGGGGSCYQFAGEVPVFCLDLQPENCEAAWRAGCVGVCGDSAVTLDGLLRPLRAHPALFWLDAHWNDPDDPWDPPCPLERELRAILDWPWRSGSRVVVDDFGLFGANGFPSWETLEALLAPAAHSGIEVGDNIVRMTVS